MIPALSGTTDVILFKKNDIQEKEYGFNGIVTSVKKVAEAKKLSLSGVMFWQLAGDLTVNHEKSLLRAIFNELKK